MARVSLLQLPYPNWPSDERCRFEAAFVSGDRFDEAGPGAHLAERTREAYRVSYAQCLRYASNTQPKLLTLPPEVRINRQFVAGYVDWLGRSHGDASVAISLRHLRLALRLISPNDDWGWLLTIAKRIAADAPHKPGKYNCVTSEQLYTLGLQLMDRAAADARRCRRVSKAQAFQYRDGLLIALLALIPLRRRTLTALRIGKHLVKAGDRWALDIPAADTKTRRPLDYPISRELSRRIDVYLDRFRRRIPGAERHCGLWASNKGCPMSDDAIYAAVRKRTKQALGFGVNPHRFRHAAASFWSIQDPVNVRGAKDLLGQASFASTEKHYIMAQSRLAGRAFARALEAVR